MSVQASNILTDVVVMHRGWLWYQYLSWPYSVGACCFWGKG